MRAIHPADDANHNSSILNRCSFRSNDVIPDAFTSDMAEAHGKVVGLALNSRDNGRLNAVSD